MNYSSSITGPQSTSRNLSELNTKHWLTHSSRMSLQTLFIIFSILSALIYIRVLTVLEIWLKYYTTYEKGKEEKDKGE